jgi:hypothetical protein
LGGFDTTVNPQQHTVKFDAYVNRLIALGVTESGADCIEARQLSRLTAAPVASNAAILLTLLIIV